jgi:hypothetical protein
MPADPRPGLRDPAQRARVSQLQRPSRGRVARRGPQHLWVPKISSTLRDQAIFVDRATDASPPSYAKLPENDRLG